MMMSETDHYHQCLLVERTNHSSDGGGRTSIGGSIIIKYEHIIFGDYLLFRSCSMQYQVLPLVLFSLHYSRSLLSSRTKSVFNL